MAREKAAAKTPASPDGPASAAAAKTQPSPGVAPALVPGMLFPRVQAVHEQALTRMQRVSGNRAVARMLVQRDPPTPTNIAGPAPAPVPADLQEFRDRGAMPAAAAGTLVQPSNGRGAFQARYDPVGMSLTITMNVAMTFANGINLTGNRAVANDPSLNAAATRINRMPRAQRAAEVARWQWSGEQETWMAGYRTNVTSAWGTAGSGLTFQSSHAGWESQLARVNVVVNTQNVTTTGPLPPGASALPAGATTHCRANIYKTPDDNNDFGAAVWGRDSAGATRLDLGSGQTVAHGHLLRQSVFFRRGSVTLDSTARAALQNIIFSFQTPTGGTGTNIDITGHADTAGASTPAGEARNVQISEQRAQAVADYLKATRTSGNNLANATTRIKTTTGTGSTGEAATGQSRRVDINFAGGGGQNVAAHEFGHMLGLMDLYSVDTTGGGQGVSGGTGGAVGTATTDDARTQGVGLGRSVHENNDNLMSLGNTIQSPQYLTFMEALRTVTGSAEWRMKP